MDNLYYLEGRVSIPTERKAEFNRNVLDILRLRYPQTEGDRDRRKKYYCGSGTSGE